MHGDSALTDSAIRPADRQQSAHERSLVSVAVRRDYETPRGFVDGRSDSQGLAGGVDFDGDDLYAIATGGLPGQLDGASHDCGDNQQLYRGDVGMESGLSGTDRSVRGPDGQYDGHARKRANGNSA